MRTIKNGIKTEASCIHARGHGADYYKCSKTGKNCPHQSWCTKKHLFDFKGSKTVCPDYEHK